MRSIESSSTTTTCQHTSFHDSDKYMNHTRDDNKLFNNPAHSTREDDAKLYTRENMENDGKEEQQQIFASYCKTTVV